MRKSDRQHQALEIAPGAEARMTSISLNEIRKRELQGERLTESGKDIRAVHIGAPRGLAPCIDIAIDGKQKTLHGTVLFVKLSGTEIEDISPEDVAQILGAAIPWTNAEIEESRWWKR